MLQRENNVYEIGNKDSSRTSHLKIIITFLLTNIIQLNDHEMLIYLINLYLKKNQQIGHKTQVTVWETQTCALCRVKT